MANLTTLTNAQLEARNRKLDEKKQAIRAQQLEINAEWTRRHEIAPGRPDEGREPLRILGFTIGRG
mgnify:CR=1 FL=1